MWCSLPCARNANTFLSLHVLEKKKKHILIKSPTIEYVKKGVGQQAEKNCCNTKQTWMNLPPESSTDLEPAQDEEFTQADSNKPNGNHNNIFRVAWGTWEPDSDPCRARQTSDFQVYQALCKACLLWNCIHKNPRKTQASIHVMISVMVQRLATAPARLP